MKAEQVGPVDPEKRLAELQKEKEVLLDRLQAARTKSAALAKALTLVHEMKERRLLFDGALEAAMELTGAEAGSIVMVDETEHPLLRFESSRGEKAAALVGYTLKPGQGIVGWVVEQGIAQIVPDPAKDARYFGAVTEEVGYEVSNILCVPLRKEGVVVGALELLNKRAGRGFTALDVEVAEIFASQVGTLLQVAESLAVGVG